MVQSEVQLVYRNSKKGDIDEKLKTTSPICPKKKQRVLVYNHDFLCAEYQYSMLTGFSMTAGLYNKDKVRALVLGTGAGLLPMFLRSQLGEALSELVTVEINPEMLKVAKEYFGFSEDEKVKAVIQDAYEYVNQGGAENFDIILMDINYEEADLGISPP